MGKKYRGKDLKFTETMRLLEHSEEAILCLAPNNLISYANKAACTYLGYAQEELLQMKLSDISDAAEGLLDALQESADGLPLRFTLPYRNREQAILPSEVSLEHIAIDNNSYRLARLKPLAGSRDALQYLSLSGEQLFKLNEQGEVISFYAGKDALFPLDTVRHGQKIQDLLPEPVRAIFATAIDNAFTQDRRQHISFCMDKQAAEAWLVATPQHELLAGIRVLRPEEHYTVVINPASDSRILFEHIPSDSIAFFDKEMRYTWVHVSEGYLEPLKAFTLGKTLKDVSSPEHYQKVLPYYEAALQGKKTTYEILGIDQLYYSCTTLPRYNSQGELIGGIIIFLATQKLKETEAALREKIALLEASQKNYRTIARNIPNGMVLMFNQELRLVLADGGALKHFIRNGNEVEDKLLDEVFYPELAARLKPYFQLALEGQQLAFEVQSLDGHWFQCICCTLPGEEGQGYGMAVYLDIDKLKRAESELINRYNEIKQSEKLYRGLVENIPNGVLVLFDKELRYTLVEGKGIDLMIGASRDEMLNRTLYEVFPQQIIEVLEPVYKAALDGQTNTFEIKGIYHGTNYLVTVLPLVGYDGTVEGGMIAAFDTDKLRNVENELEWKVQELERSQMLYKTLAGNIPNGSLLLFDEDLRFTLVEGKAADLAGFSKEMLEGRSIQEVIQTQPDALGHLENLFYKVLDGDTISMETNSFSTQRWFNITLLPVRYNNGSKGGMMVLFDIQDRKNVEKDIEDKLHELALLNDRLVKEVEYRKAIETNLQAYTNELKIKNQELEQFAYVASHDLQEPLRMISSFTQLLAQRYSQKLDDEAMEYISFAVEGAHRMQALINDLLEYSRVGRRNNPVNLPLSLVIYDVLQNLAHKIEETSAMITYDSLPEVHADRTQMVQLFQNLISNAIKFRRKDVPLRVHIRLEEQKKTWRFTVSDNGIGFNMTHRERIFSIFQRLHTRDQYEGTGIGLALCKKIVEHHGGEIWAESTEGKGSTFYFTLAKASV